MRDRMRYALKFGYNGGGFSGWARQPGQMTVEGEILNALKESEIVRDFSNGNLKVASRTDSGVSALGNVLAVTTEFKRDGIISALNAHLEDIWFYGISIVGEEFNPRYAKERWYRYHLLGCECDEESMQETARIFLGSHDFSNLSKPDGRSPQRTINSIQITKEEGMIILDIRAQSFLWNMVRRIVKAILEVEANKITRDDIRSALNPEMKADFQMTPPEPLVLMDVAYDFAFEINSAQLAKLKARLREEMNAAFLRTRIYKDLIQIIEKR